MTLPSSGTIRLSDLRGEFGGSVPDAISEYYRGGGLVPNIAANSAIPTSGAISLSDFYNATGLGTQRLSTTITAGSSSPNTGYISGALGSIATISYTDGGGNSRSINAVFHSSSTGLVAFRLVGTSIANTDATFKFISINGTLYQRSAATYTASAPGSTTQWAWTASNPFGANPNPFLVYSS